MEPVTIGTILGGVATGLITGVGGFLAFRRKMSRDGVEFTKDRTEIGVIDLLTKQRDEALAAQEELNAKLQQNIAEKQACLAELAKLKSDFTKLQEKLKLTDVLVKRLSSTLDYTKSELEKIIKEQQEKRDN